MNELFKNFEDFSLLRLAENWAGYPDAEHSFWI
jgi:hypothetical protein